MLTEIEKCRNQKVDFIFCTVLQKNWADGIGNAIYTPHPTTPSQYTAPPIATSSFLL